ncbi:hypothetical protein DFA_01787 [Cavenderia fasciculata]|uniref:G domain-containing protein n=1 Tax=Cavenderia fasciculata TaxID=261658 RepID=F4PUT9_CACFS|nr:uncharacterized protein DFA_01787 [Cavenderia fasciculata]EGG21901.1 hypothetical protein DFA_01787 [Cavenderia fasciculata]|eukprot:XP_004359752.1 hypothetical protein DFA_01787 [Cavenderia fasciculata]
MKYHLGNVDKIKYIEGVWKEDQVSYPATIIYSDGAIEKIGSPEELGQWNEIRQTFYKSQSLQTKTMESDRTTQFRVSVDRIKDETFHYLYNRIKGSLDPQRKQFFAIFMGITGSGKSTLVEFILNILTGQLGSPQTLRAKDLEAAGIGKSKTTEAYRYDIEFVIDDKPMFTLTLIDTPGFADTNGIDKDRAHIKSILRAVSKIERLDNVTYVVPVSLTRQTLESLNVLCQVFSILPAEAFSCISTAITFGDNRDQASSVLNVLDQMLPGIKGKPATFINNPWAQHSANTNKEVKAESLNLTGVDNTNDLNLNINEKAKEIGIFLVERLESKQSFESKGMNVLNSLIDTLVTELGDLTDIFTVYNHAKNNLALISLNNNKEFDRLVTSTDNSSMEEYFKQKGYAIKDGKPMAKVIGNELWPGGVYSTICLAPGCIKDVCQEGCSYFGVNFDNCHLFNEPETVCQVLSTYQKMYEKQLSKFKKLESILKKLSIFGNIQTLLECALETYRVQLEALKPINDEKTTKHITDIMTSFESFIKTVKDSGTPKKSIRKELAEIEKRRNEKIGLLSSWIKKINGQQKSTGPG